MFPTVGFPEFMGYESFLPSSTAMKLWATFMKKNLSFFKTQLLSKTKRKSGKLSSSYMVCNKLSNQ